MNQVQKILMERDDMTAEEAKAEISAVREEVLEAIECGEYDSVEDIVSDELGLEMDYIFDILG